MNEEAKEPLIQRVVDRLAASYPETPEDHIEDIVADEYATLDGGRIRSYIPILVERGSWKRLHHERTRRTRNH